MRRRGPNEALRTAGLEHALPSLQVGAWLNGVSESSLGFVVSYPVGRTRRSSHPLLRRRPRCRHSTASGRGSKSRPERKGQTRRQHEGHDPRCDSAECVLREVAASCHYVNDEESLSGPRDQVDIPKWLASCVEDIVLGVGGAIHDYVGLQIQDGPIGQSHVATP